MSLIDNDDFHADLHTHSTCSDGTLSPLDLIQLASKNKLSGLSITDHDTIDAYDSTLFTAAKECGIEIITGVEFSCVHRRKSIHILGYDFSLENGEIRDYCEKHKRRRIERFRKILQLLKRSNMNISEEELLENVDASSIGRPHVAAALVKKGYAKDSRDAFRRFIAEGRPFYVKGEAFPIQETIDVIHRAGGFAVIAHPHIIRNAVITRELLEMNFDGIECFYSRFDKKTNLHFVEIAKQKNWLITGGSDFHGSAKRDIILGCAWTDGENFSKLKKTT